MEAAAAAAAAAAVQGPHPSGATESHSRLTAALERCWLSVAVGQQLAPLPVGCELLSMMVESLMVSAVGQARHSQLVERSRQQRWKYHPLLVEYPLGSPPGRWSD